MRDSGIDGRCAIDDQENPTMEVVARSCFLDQKDFLGLSNNVTYFAARGLNFRFCRKQ